MSGRKNGRHITVSGSSSGEAGHSSPTSQNPKSNAEAQVRMKGLVLIARRQARDAESVGNIESHCPTEVAEVLAAIPGQDVYLKAHWGNYK